MKSILALCIVSLAVAVGASGDLVANEKERRLDINTASSLWDQYSEVFGARLQSTIANIDTLQEVIVSDVQSMSGDSQSVTQVACTTYENGHNLATYIRENATSLPAGSIVRPFHVSESGDKMCFAIYSPTQLPPEILSLLSFKLSIPSSLKVETSVYDFIDFPAEALSASSASKMTHLSVSFLMNATMLSHDPELSNGDEIYRAAQDLRSYHTHAFQNFFWSASSTSAYFDKTASTTSIMNTDALRAYKWSSLANMFQTTLDIPSSVDGSAPDPCNFRAMAVEKHVDRVMISLDAIRSLPTNTQSACIALMTASLAQQPSTWHISLTNSAELFNYRARSITQTSTVGSDSYFVPYTRMGLRGAGEVVAVADTGADVESCFLIETTTTNAAKPSSIYSPTTNLNARKIVQYTYLPGGDYKDDVSGHGSHVVGSVVGNKLGSSLYQDGMYDGVAPDGKAAVMDLGSGGSVAVPPASILYSPGRSAGARVHTNSWGSSDPSVYYYTAADTDQFLYDHMDMTVFFAAGNTGSSGARSVSLQSQAKNVVSIGSSQTTYNSASIDYVSWFSSQGPAFDGRIKPELVSPGEKIVSVNSNGGNGQSCSTIAKMGTSMASPTAAGNALLVRQYFKGTQNDLWTSMCNTAYQFCKEFTPSGVLVKAVLLHSGTPMQLYNGASLGQSNVNLGSDAPDNYQGYGRIKLLNALPLAGYTSFDLFVDDLNVIGERTTITYTVTVRDPSIPLKVTLSWYDPASVQGTSSSVLLNNIDLMVTSPSGSSYYGNGRSSADQINNNEQVIITSPKVGDYKVKVFTNSLPVTGSQKYSIVITSAGHVTK